MIGGSHGGYLAHLAAKIAPWLVDGVLDNSAYAKFLWRVVGFGKEIDFMQYSEFATFDFFHHIKTHCSTKTFWTSNSSSPRFFFSRKKKNSKSFRGRSSFKTIKMFKNLLYKLSFLIR